ncbi:recombination mediator RecR [Singulisphaera acidiphila]|uniref:Recombination protein RecR n=1 Tax=Singulisphaera acidiphila (strain ATCC BAA-1392 / DSM 18658 / VKM B-2454 / MOB10) TaxID=886293 RepID=L0D8G3_SINAD|nr:recombination mediator RecR [Singulisphaera acidiphila]AGA25699.1 recombination protein RecR [Singulisphaera acidiphila DSM 18658]
MAGYSGTVDRLIDAFGRLPGVGAKTAERLAHHLLKCPAEEALALADAIRDVRERVRHCQTCYHLTEAEHPLCGICRDPRRDASVVCVVEQPRDLLALEKAGTFRGVYHVLLGRLAPLQGMGPDQLTLPALEARVRSGTIQELIMATNPNLEGDGTALLVANRLADSGVPITRLARGLASGSVLEFANKEMLADAINGRQRF